MSGEDTDASGDTGSARYVFTVRFRLDPDPEEVSVSPSRFETTMARRADPPGEPGWLFFRDNLWHGELNEPAHFRDLTEGALDVPVESVEFEELRTDEAYLDALKESIAADLSLFRADTVEEAVSKYLGSSVHVTEEGT